MVISLTGEWDGCRMHQLRERLAPAYAQSHIVLDLTRAKYVTSPLISALVLAYKHRAACGMPAASIAVRSAFVRGLLSSAGVDELYPIYESVDQALRTRRPSRHTEFPAQVRTSRQQISNRA